MISKAVALDTHMADILRHAVQAALRDTFHVETEVKPWTVQRDPVELEDCLIGVVDMRQGAQNYGCFVTAFNRNVVAKVLAAYGISGEPDRAMLHDAVSEMTNVLYGLFKTEMNNCGYAFEMDIPYIIDTRWDGDRQEKLILPFLAEGQRCRIVVSHAQ